MSKGKAVWFPTETLVKLEAMTVGNETIPSVVERLMLELKALKEGKK